MLYRQLAEVSTYVTDPSHKFSDVLQMLCIKALSPFQTDALLYTEIDQNGHAIPHTSFGIEITDKNGERPTFTISERTPFTDAIRENRIIWIDSLPTWPKQYTRMANLQLPKNLKTIICCREDSSRSETFTFDPSEYEKPLTERQNLILKLIAEGRTNAAIADVLGYSESLIRQETIKIYAKLGCSGRNEAAQIYNRMHSQNASVAV